MKFLVASNPKRRLIKDEVILRFSNVHEYTVVLESTMELVKTMLCTLGLIFS